MRASVSGWIFSVITAIRVALLLLAAGTIAPMGDAAGLSMPQAPSAHAAPYDNTGHGPQQSGLEGGGD